MGRSSRPEPNLHGCLLVDKPGGMTSHDVVARVRKALGTKKVGHGGTLDPDATGLMVLGIGFGTKLLEYVVGVDKTYEAEIRFGAETSTLDAAGEIVAEYSMDPTVTEVEAAAKTFVGHIKQVPPMVSAIKINGVRLHKLAREGKEVERPPRDVTIKRLDVRATQDPLLYSAVVDCSSGTYIRSLAADLGRNLGGGAYLAALRRTKVGNFDISQGVHLDDVTAADIQPLRTMLGDMPIIELPDAVISKVRNGACMDFPVGDGRVGFATEGGELVAVYIASSGELKPEKVAPQTS